MFLHLSIFLSSFLLIFFLQFLFSCFLAWLVYSAAIYVRHEEESGLLRLLPIAAGLYDLGTILYILGVDW
jgi:hypothetical protein